MSSLRLVADEDPTRDLPHDDALSVLNGHWRAARTAYADLLGVVGDLYMRHLIVPPAKRAISRSHMAAMRDRARDMALHATRIADELDRAVQVYDRVER
jgi:hypothetical protein